MPSNTRRHTLRKSNSNPGKELEIAASGTVLGGLPAARCSSWAVRFVGRPQRRGPTAPAPVGQVADLVVVPQRIGEPGCGAAAQRDEQALVQALQRELVNQRDSHDRLQAALQVPLVMVG